MKIGHGELFGTIACKRSFPKTKELFIPIFIAPSLRGEAFSPKLCH
jgi:hypothetical protein